MFGILDMYALKTTEVLVRRSLSRKVGRQIIINRRHRMMEEEHIIQ